MAEAAKKAVKKEKPKIDDKAGKEAAKATLQALAKTDAQKAAAVKAPSAVQTVPKSEEKAVKISLKAEPPSEIKPKAETAPVKTQETPEAAKAAPKAEAKKAEPQSEAKPKVETETPVKTQEVPEKVKATPKTEAIKAENAKPATETKAEGETKKEADPSKEFVDSIMTEMALKGGSKKRLVKMLAEQFNFDRQKVMFRLRRALITERYAAAHAEAGH